MKEFTVSENSNLKDFTSSVYPQGSFYLDILLKSGNVKVNGVKARKNTNLERGDKVSYYTDKKQEASPSHKVVYADDNIIVADKLSGVSSEGLYSELSAQGELYALHRLDRNTQGLIVYAKNEAASMQLLKAFKEGRAEKTYIALLKDNFKKQHETLTAYLEKDSEKSTVKIFDSPRQGCVKIVTEYEIKKRSGNLALAEIKLHTGKTHQIRAHMAHIGCPVLGDEKYGDNELNKQYSARRQRLIAKKLTFFGLSDGLEYLNGKEFLSSFTLGF